MFSIAGLDPATFAGYFTRSDAELAAVGARRVVADGPGYPCRVSLIDAAIGDELVLCPYLHHDVASPYRASGPVYVRRAATRAAAHVDIVPEVLRRRLLSVRAYDRDGDLREAEVAPGTELVGLVERWFAEPAVAYLHVHNARPGCFAARVDRHA
jgi:hypothetical protein